MSTIEIVAGAMLIISCILIIIIVTMQQPSGSGLSGAIMGGDASSGSVRGKTKGNEYRLSRATKVLATVFFVVTFGVNLLALAIK